MLKTSVWMKLWAQSPWSGAILTSLGNMVSSSRRRSSSHRQIILWRASTFVFSRMEKNCQLRLSVLSDSKSSTTTRWSTPSKAGTKWTFLISFSALIRDYLRLMKAPTSKSNTTMCSKLSSISISGLRQRLKTKVLRILLGSLNSSPQTPSLLSKTLIKKIVKRHLKLAGKLLSLEELRRQPSLVNDTSSNKNKRMEKLWLMTSL